MHLFGSSPSASPGARPSSPWSSASCRMPVQAKLGCVKTVGIGRRTKSRNTTRKKLRVRELCSRRGMGLAPFAPQARPARSIDFA